MNEKSVNVVNQNFRKAIPLMVANNVPVTPPYYTLWYTYVTNELPKLSERMDTMLANGTQCNRYVCDSLLDEFMLNVAESQLAELQTSIQNVVTSIGHSTENAMHTAEDLSVSLSHDMQVMAKEADQGNHPVAHKMVRIAQSFMSKTEDYRSQLAKQNAEIQALKEKIAETERQVFTDGLTSIYNRKKFNEDISIYTATNSETCVLLVDIDHFKPFNDQYGHLVGDKVIQTVAQALKLSCEQSQRGAQAYRFGGEEFAVLLPNASIEAATQFADSIRDRVSRLNLTNKKTGEKLRPITTSLGVAQFQAGETIESLLERADKRLYDAKNSGRNCVRPALAS